MASKTSNHQDGVILKSPLLRLPVELRCQIYDFVVPSDLQSFADRMATPGLLKTSKQIRDEYSDVFFGSEFLKLDAYFGEVGVWQQVKTKQVKRAIFETSIFTDMSEFWSLASARRYCQRLYSDWQGNVLTGIMTIVIRSGIYRFQWSVASVD